MQVRAELRCIIADILKKNFVDMFNHFRLKKVWLDKPDQKFWLRHFMVKCLSWKHIQPPTCLNRLRWQNTNRSDPICIKSFKMPKANTGQSCDGKLQTFLQKSMPIYLTTLVRKHFELTDETKILIKLIYDKHFELKTYFVVN